ncbi:alginate lyase-domain-containing protein [Entophlyctis helioformis]|nr:alginate lyase-domain-containing protein [Entophlyctis helioformis]
MLPPSNDPHDYYSAARYYWPDAAKPPSGLPYARFDGYTNPEIYLHQDPQFLQVVIDDVFNCALAFFYTRNETYAATAARRLQVWFIDPVTAMNPNLNYANWVKGIDPAILHLGKLYLLIDAIGILRTSTSFTQTHYTGMQTWIAQFYTWTQTSPRALALSKSINNQGTWFDVQQVAMLLFLGRVSEATSVLQTVTVPRMLLQITANGSQPQEQSRTLSWFYSAYNIQGLFVLGFLSQSTPFNLFQYQDAQGRSLVRALDYMLPYATTNGSGWPVANRGNFDPAAVVELCKLAYIVYRDVKYIGVANELQAKPKIWNPVRLWTPYMAFDAPVRSSAARAASHGLWQMVAVGASVVIGAALL